MNRSSGRIPIRWQPTIFLTLSLLVLAFLYLLPAASVVWATPQQSRLRQTVPTLTPTPIPSWLWIGRAGDNAVDYAPSGMPDFDQKQADWHDGASPQVWTHCGPVAVVDVLWWLDSWSEPGSSAPPAVHDGHALITSLGDWDDHDVQNVVPVVNDLAARLDTHTSGERPGTDVSSLVPALQTYLEDIGLQDAYTVTMASSPSFGQLFTWVQKGSGVVLLLGFWEWQGDRWIYLGGHYVAVAGAEPVNRYIALSDPFRDAFEAGEAVLGRSPVTHAYPHGVDVHNDAQYVSQDAYRVVATEGPGGMWALNGYVHYPNAYHQVRNFIGQNVTPDLGSYRGDYEGAAITTKVDYAIVLSRKPDSYTLLLPIILKRVR